MEMTDELNPRVGLLGELEVEMRLVQKGWHPVRLDTAQMASNADLLAVNRKLRVSIQVKTTDAFKQHSASYNGEVAEWLQFGYSTGYLRNKKPVFNAKDSPLIADVIVAVSYHPKNSRFVVMPVAFAETLCCLHCDYWSRVQTKVGGKRSDTFPIYLPFVANRKAHAAHFDQVKRNVLKFEDA
ncbi:MAG: hypothetical protein ABSA48_07175 [Terracidiphilus sp.]|jgi:hypothetical protein